MVTGATDKENGCGRCCFMHGGQARHLTRWLLNVVFEDKEGVILYPGEGHLERGATGKRKQGGSVMGEKWEMESDGVWCGDIVGRGGCLRPCRTLLGKPVKDTVKH